MTAKQVLNWVRRLWIPAFLLACAVFMARHTEELLAGFSWPRLQAPGYLALAFALQVAVWWLLISAWQRVLAARLSIHVEFAPALRQFALFSLGKYLPGKVWGLLARASDLSRGGVTVGRSLNATIYEQMIVIHAAILVAAILFALTHPGHLSLAISVIAAFSVFLGPALYDLMLRLLNSTLSRLGREKAASKPVGVARLRYATLLGRYAFAWLGHGLVLVTIYFAISPTSSAEAVEKISLLVLANTVGMLAGFAAFFAPAGLGVREAALTAILATGLSLQDAVTLSLLMRLWTLVTDLGLGATLLIRRTAGD